LRGIRKKVRNGRCLLFLCKEDAERMSSPGTGKWRLEFVNNNGRMLMKRWLTRKY
jgi:hypothetical protein